ncbi:MAG: hypothetical protein JOZ81_06030 [Chloroflexi bacterium]|nr:hypothetical protein [Chloroflexota bacterium]
MRALLYLYLCLVGLSSACAASNVPPTPGPSPAAAPASVASPKPGVSPSASPGPEAQQAVNQATHDAAQRLSVSDTDISVDRVEPRQWPDASLGCPRQGDVYAQVVTPGYLIVVSGGGQQLEYHSDARGRVILCSQ